MKRLTASLVAAASLLCVGGCWYHGPGMRIHAPRDISLVVPRPSRSGSRAIFHNHHYNPRTGYYYDRKGARVYRYDRRRNRVSGRPPRVAPCGGRSGLRVHPRGNRAIRGSRRR